MPENRSLPRKRCVSASAASVPSTVARVADKNATRSDTEAASSMASSRNSSRYQRSEAPAQTVTRRESLRSEEHTSELQSHVNLACRLLLEKKKTKTKR